MANIQIALINASTVLTDQEVQAALPALQTQVHRDFAPVWGIDADLIFVSDADQPPSTMWWLVVLDNTDQAAALGYHDLSDQGLPLGKVFAGTDLQAGYEWTVTASHEMLEMLADPDINLSAFVQDSTGGAVFYAYEVCDPCQAQNYGYTIDTTLVSDFVYPAWFESFRAPNSTQFDYGNHMQQPFELLAGGYTSVFDASSGTGWQTLTAAIYKYDRRPRPGTRRERRRIPRNQWLTSKVKISRQMAEAY
jgi:hypothetical protein